MKTYLRLTVKHLELAEKVLKEAGIFYEGNIDIHSEVAKAAIKVYFDDYDAKIQKLQKEHFRLANFFHLREAIEEAVLQKILDDKSDFVCDTLRIEREINSLVDSDDFMTLYRTESVEDSD